MTFISKYERASGELRTAAARRDRVGLTPQHTAATAGLADGEYAGDEPGDELTSIREPDSVKVFWDAYEVPTDYPQPIQISAEDFRRGPIRAGQEAPSPGDDCA